MLAGRCGGVSCFMPGTQHALRCAALQGLLRTKEVMERLRASPAPAGQKAPLLIYLGVLLQKAKLNGAESAELARCARARPGHEGMWRGSAHACRMLYRTMTQIHTHDTRGVEYTESNESNWFASSRPAPAVSHAPW